jgi:hypothetical protein
MLKLRNLLLVAAFALTTGLGQSAIAESTDVPKVTTPETTITQLHEPATAEIGTMNDTAESEVEIVEGIIVGEALSADQLDSLITKVHQRGCHRRSCFPPCPACSGAVGHCKSGGRFFSCRRS